MADVEISRENTVASSPEKKVVDEEKKEVAAKETPTKDVKEVEVDENSKASENGDSKEAKENGEEKEVEESEKEVESTNGDSTNGDSNGDSTDAPNDTCCIKRKSTGGDVTDDAKEVASPKKAKLDDKPAPVEVESNGS